MTCLAFVMPPLRQCQTLHRARTVLVGGHCSKPVRRNRLEARPQVELLANITTTPKTPRTCNLIYENVPISKIVFFGRIPILKLPPCVSSPFAENSRDRMYYNLTLRRLILAGIFLEHTSSRFWEEKNKYNSLLLQPL